MILRGTNFAILCPTYEEFCPAQAPNLRTLIIAIGEVGNGLRLLEFEKGVAASIDDTNSAELVDYERSRAAGQAAQPGVVNRKTRWKTLASYWPLKSMVKGEIRNPLVLIAW